MPVIIAAGLLALATACPAAPEGWFPFHVADIEADSAVDCSALRDSVAGDDGFVRIEDGHFVDGSGQRIRFLGTNLTFGDAFPDPDMAPKIADQMARLGINCVRFHHMDHHHAPRGIWDPEYQDRRHLAPGQLERLDRIIYELKQRGIYTNLNLHVSRKFTAAQGFENADELPRYDKGVDNIDRRMIDLQKEYARDLLTHVNPHTGSAYVDEPCVAMVELNNENSALRYARDGTLHTLPDPYRSDLQGRWVAWLQERYGSTDALREAWQEHSEPLAEEILQNGGFAAGTDGWSLQVIPPAGADAEVVSADRFDRALRVHIRKQGDLSWATQLHQTGLDLSEGQYYTLCFAIRSDQRREANVSARFDCPDWRMIGLNRRISVETEWRRHELLFRATEPKPDHTRISFNFLNEPGEVFIANVSLRPGGYLGLPETQTLEKGNIEFPHANEPTAARADWFEFIIGLERQYTGEMYAFLKDELGLHAQVIDTQVHYGQIGGLWRESHMDYADMHAYWQHPRFPGRPWDAGNWYIPNSPMVDERGSDRLSGLSMVRLDDKSYTISEYNHPAPNDYRAECMPMLATFAAVQDWDGIFQFCYGETPDHWSEAEIQGYFRMVTDPAKVALFPIAANLFRRGDLQPASRQAILRLPSGAGNVARLMAQMESRRQSIGDLWNDSGVDSSDILSARLSVDFTRTDRPRVESTETGSSAPTVEWTVEEGRGVLAVATPETVVWTGAIADKTRQTPDLQVDVGETSNGYATVAVTSMDGRPIARASRLLVVALNRVENQDMGWSDDRTTVGRQWGHGPPIAEGVSVKLRLEGRSVSSLWALDGHGRSSSKIPVSGATMELSPAHETLWYEIRAGSE